jgi:putative ABC transport system permease protein
MIGLLQDLRYALRQLRKSPGFTVVVVATLGLGIGANTAIFSVVNTVLLAPLPYRDVDHLTMIWGRNPSRGDQQFPVSAGDFTDWRQKNDVFEDIAASYDDEVTLTGSGEPKLVLGYAISPNYFRILAVAPRLGRTFTDEEAKSGTSVAVLSDKMWRTTFRGDPGILGRSVILDAKSYTVIGVMPPEFDFPSRTELWMPLAIAPAVSGDYEHRYIRVIGRLKPGVSVSQAQTRMNTLERHIAAQHPETDAGNETWIEPVRQQLVGDIRTPLLALSGAVVLVLFIACVNIASLLLARAASRRVEISVRVAIGAGRFRLLQQFLIESLLLSFLGGAFGIVLALWSSGFLLAIFPNGVANLSIPKVDAIPINAPVLCFAFGVTLFTGLLFGVIPVLQSASVSGNDALKESSRGLTSTSKSARFRRALVTAEIALSLILLMGGGLMIESFRQVYRTGLGFYPDRVLGLEVFLPPNQYPRDQPQKQNNFVNNVLDRLNKLPGVQSAAAANFLPLTGFWGTTDFAIEGRPVRKGDSKPFADNRRVTPVYFSTMGISLLRGREFTDSDRAESEKVAMINTTLAHRYFGSEDPIGKVLQLGDSGHEEKWRIVGVVSDVKAFGPEEATHADLYRPLEQSPSNLLGFAVRATGDPSALLKPAEQAVWDVDKDQPVFDAMPMGVLAAQSVTLRRTSTILLASFAILALLLAAIGLYGVMAYSVVQRTHEIGLRMALGALHSDVLRLVIRQAMWLLIIGEAIGVIAALLLTHAAASLLYGVNPGDPWAVAVAMAVLTLVALAACYVPARRAAKVDPMEALRYE